MRKTGLVTIAGVLATLALSACGGGGGGAKTATLSDAANAAAADCQGTPVNGGSLVYARQAETQSINPLDARNGNGDIFADNLIYGGLVRSDPKGSTDIQPALADKWTVSNGGKTYTFHLRDGIKFSNGQPVTAEDVKFSLDRFGNPKTNAIMSSVAVGYGTSKVVDPSTIRFDLKQPVASFLYNISIFPAFIVPKDLVEQQGAAFWKKPVGTGPFTVKEFVRGSHITFAKNPNYWEAGKPYLDTVRYNFAVDANSRIVALRGGTAQIMDGVPFSQITSLQGDKKVVVQSAKVPLFLGLWLNHERKPLADLNVRKAIQTALDRELMNKSIFRGLGKIPNSVLMSLRYDAPASGVKPYPYDVTAAKAYMAKSAYPKGFSTTLQYPSGYDYYKQLGLLMQQELAAIGIKVKLREIDGATATANWSSQKYDMTFPFASFTSDVTVPDEYSDFLADYGNGLKGFFSSWRDPKIQAMVLDFTKTIDEGQRAQKWPKIQQALMDATPVINVMNLPFVNAHAATTCGTAVDALGSDHLEDTWLASAASKN
ncbi:MAG: transporter substrate-binding protein [Conexibacter sp.]|nr:transporter substrate-binding protein [Conexibacter sp.]